MIVVEDQILYLLTRQRFTSQHHDEVLRFELDQAIDWDTLFITAEQQHVAPLVYNNLSSFAADELSVPQSVLNKFKQAYINNVFVKRGTAEILEKVLALFASKNIDVMLIKGEAINTMVYDQPWYTVSQDVDLVIHAMPEEINQTDHAEITKTLDTFNKKRSRFKENIEYDFYEHHDMTMNNVLSVDFQRLWAEARKVELYGQPVYVLTIEDMLIAAAVNCCRKRFFWLKSICDIATIIEKHPDLDWARLATKSQAYRCAAILYTALVVTQMTVGCNIPNEFLDSLKVNPFRESTILRLLENMIYNHSLAELAVRAKVKVLGREFSRSLMLVYASYPLQLLMPKLLEIYKGWRNPPPVPV